MRKRMQINELSTDLMQKLGKINLFVCSASYEERCMSIPTVLKEIVLKVVIAENENHKAMHRPYVKQLDKLFPKASWAMLDTTQPLKTADALFKMVEGDSIQDKHIVVDMTTFTHETLLILFKVLDMKHLLQRTLFLYCCAKTYSNEELDGKKWLSRGVGVVRSVLGYPGQMRPSQNLHLIVLTGFEVERVSELIRRYEPSIISLGYPKSDEPNASLHENLSSTSYKILKAIHGSVQEFVFDCYDPQKTEQAIVDQMRKITGHNTVVAPLNTKLSTIGEAMAATSQEDIQLCYAEALVYNYQHYSTPGDTCYLFQADATKDW
jgi:hypothetical protein